MCWKDCVSSGGFREEDTSLSFLASRGPVRSLVHGPLPPCSEHIIPISGTVVISPFHSLFLNILPPSYKDLCDYTGPRQITQELSPHIKIFNLITSAQPLLPCKVTYSQVLGIRMWTSLGGHYSVYHRM